MPGEISDAAESFGDDDIGNRKMDAQGNEFDGNVMGAAQNVRSEGGRGRRGGRNRGEGRGEGGRNEGGRGRGRDRGGRNRGEGNEGRGNRGRNHAPSDVDDNIGNRAPKEEVRVAYQAKPRTEGSDEPQRNRDYEKVNEVSGDKKKGWWKKLTG